MVCKKTCTVLYLVYCVYKQNMYFNQNIEHGLAWKLRFVILYRFHKIKQAF